MTAPLVLAPSDDLPPPKVLLVDDHPANLQALHALLEGLHVSLVDAHSGEEALGLIDHSEFAVILLDVRMPVLDGFETARRIRESEQLRSTPIIFVTAADADRDELEKGYALGAADFLIKPLLPTALRAKVNSFLDLYNDRCRARRQADQLRSLVEGTTDYAIFLLDVRGNVVTWNPGAERINQYRADEILGRHFSRFYPREAIDRRWPEQELQFARANGRFEDEGWRVRKDGSQFWANVIITALRNESGELRGFSKITRDMTERREAELNEKRLAEEGASRRVAEEHSHQMALQNERLRVTLMSIGDAVIATDNAGRVTLLNPVAESLTGWPTAEAGGQPVNAVFQIINEITRQQVENPADKVLATGQTVELANHTLLISRDGHERPINDTASPILAMDGSLAGSILVFRDVTEKRNIEKERSRQHETARLLAAIVESSDDAIVSKSLDGVIQTWNAGAQRLFGYTPEEAIGKPITLLIPPERLAEEDSILSRIRAGVGVEHFETIRLRKDGHAVHVSLTISPVKDATGTIIGASKIARDIGDRIRTETDLRDASRRKDEFLATLAHELRNPLAPIRNSLQILRLPHLDAETIQETTEMMERQVEQLVRLVDDLLDVSRITQGKVALKKEVLELSAVVASGIELARPLIDARAHKLTVELPPESTQIEVDPVRAAQVVGNLLTNAAKYTNSHGQISVTARRCDDEIELRVRDDGIGIAPDMLPHIFDLFVQADLATTREHTGLGIGLTLVKSLVEMHGGDVEVHSAGLGTGSEFVVRLPLAAASNGTRPKRGGHRRPAFQCESRRVLVVDDNKDAATSLATLLRSYGCDIRVVHDGQSALALAEEFKPQAIFLDLGMPLMDGYEVARRMRQIPGLNRIRIAALTGWGTDEDRRRTADAGFDDHLVKPADPDLLQFVLSAITAPSG